MAPQKGILTTKKFVPTTAVSGLQREWGESELGGWEEGVGSTVFYLR